MQSAILVSVTFVCGVMAAILLLYSIAIVRKARPSNREHMDPLPWGIALVWGAVNVLQSHVSEIAPTSMLLRWKRRLQLAGLEYILRPEEFIAVRAISMAIAGILAGLVAWFLKLDGVWTRTLVLGALALGWVYPAIWVGDRKKRRDKEILRTLPGYLDLITLCCQAGLGLSAAISQAVQKGPRGALHEEFERLLREMRTGMSRIDALNAMAERMDNKHIRGLVSNLTQAESLGASIADTLAAIADQRRTERFQHAEKLAMEAPVKMLGPLVIFIFPVTFLVIFFPLAVQMFSTLK
ncbi:tight adherence protein C [Acidovorax sp. 62]|uniref:type II secretion system F family protein n=1 Tax=Acidovorax sp. 62 TaxID=2035203 RepID=UPI000C18E14D|nr:type II secretion system F family protein [Acidovorax sp. 62]PIF93397.1 tight adherence protein C [Acidovorax sp. 62]